MQLTVAGSGTAAPEAERVCSGYLVEAEGTRALFDCGPGVVHHMARFGLPWQEIDHVFLTHFHNDHTGDLPMLFFALKWGTPRRRQRPLTVWGPGGLHTRLRAMAAGLGDHVEDPGFPVSIREIGPGDIGRAGAFTVTATETPHTEESLAYRIVQGEERSRASGDPGDGAGASLGYTGDTGPSQEVASFLAGVDVLLAECSLPDDQPLDIHLTPTSLAAMATRSGPGRLVVTHVYPQLSGQDVLGLIRDAGYDGPTFRAHDGLHLDIGP
jgi:ribonuclease BN (tRNA processing enzyme)